MKKENIYIYFSLTAVAIMGIVTMVVLFQKEDNVEPLPEEVTITTPPVTPEVTLFVSTTPYVTTRPTETPVVTPTIINQQVSFVGIFEGPEMSINGLPQGEYYSFAYYTGNDSTIHYMLNKANNSLSQGETDILGLGNIYPLFRYRITSTRAQDLPGAAAGNTWSVLSGDVNVEIRGEYAGESNPGGSSDYHIYIARGDGANGGDWILSVNDEDAIKFSTLKTANIGDTLYLSGKILEGGGAALGTAYVNFEPDSISK